MKETISAITAGVICLLAGMNQLSAVAVNADMPTTKTVFYVAVEGNDTWSGQLTQANDSGTDGPFATIEKAQQAVREYKQKNGLDRPVQIIIRAGEYILDQPLSFKAADSGTGANPITYSAYKGEKVVFSGGRKLTGQWIPYKDGIWKKHLPAVQAGKWYFRQLFVDGQRQTRARTPNNDFYHIEEYLPGEEKQAFIYKQGDIQSWHNLNDVEIMVFHSWSESRLLIRDLEQENNIVHFTGPAAYHFSKWKPPTRYYVENVLEGLDSPGEWYLDRKSGNLYYQPGKDVNLQRAEVVAPKLTHLVEFSGEDASRQPVHHIVMDGLTFCYTDYQLPASGYPNGGAWKGPVFRPSAITLETAEDCVIRNCQILNVATYAIELKGKQCHRNRIEANTIKYCGGGGIVIYMGNDNVVNNNHIHHCGQIFFGGTGVVNAFGTRTRISHNLIHHMPYCGIRGGGGAPYWAMKLDEVIEYNHIYHVMQMLDDGAGIFNAGSGTIIRNNLVHDSFGYKKLAHGIYLDEFRKGVRVENNITFNTRGCFLLHNNYGNEIVNNIFALGTNYQIRWTKFHGKHFGRQVEPPGDAYQIFQRNIVYWKEGIFSPDVHCNRHDLNRRKELIDYNLYYQVGKDSFMLGENDKCSFTEWQKSGMDVHSLVADPMFRDPDNGDFTLKPGSPAFKLGIKPIDISQAGIITRSKN